MGNKKAPDKMMGNATWDSELPGSPGEILHNGRWAGDEKLGLRADFFSSSYKALALLGSMRAAMFHVFSLSLPGL